MLLLLAIACAEQAPVEAGLAAGATAQAIEALPSKPPQVESQREAAADTPDAPSGTEAVLALLAARHVDDLPPREVIDSHGDGQAILQYIAEFHPGMVEAERATLLLASYPASTEFCLARAQADIHPKLQAAGLRCVVGRELSEAQLQVAQDALASDDPRLQSAAQVLLSAQPSP